MPADFLNADQRASYDQFSGEPNIERAIDSLKRKGISLNEQLISHLFPLGWEHINLSGDYVWRTNLKLGQGKYRSLRSVDSSLYKKQA